VAIKEGVVFGDSNSKEISAKIGFSAGFENLGFSATIDGSIAETIKHSSSTQKEFVMEKIIEFKVAPYTKTDIYSKKQLFHVFNDFNAIKVFSGHMKRMDKKERSLTIS